MDGEQKEKLTVRRVLRRLYFAFRTNQDQVPNPTSKKLVIAAMIGILLSLAFCVYIFMLDLSLGYTAEHDALKMTLKAGQAASASADTTEEASGEPIEGESPYNFSAAATAITPAPALRGETS